MFVVRFANLSLTRYLTNPRVIAWLPALKGPLEPRLLTEILLFWATLNENEPEGETHFSMNGFVRMTVQTQRQLRRKLPIESFVFSC